jgi:hypothetical protein
MAETDHRKIPAIRRPSLSLAAEARAAPDRGRYTGFARHQALAAAPAGELVHYTHFQPKIINPRS